MFTFGRIRNVQVLCFLEAPRYAFVEEVGGELYVFAYDKGHHYTPLANFLVLTDFLSIGAAGSEEEAVERTREFVSKWGALSHSLYGIPYSQMFNELIDDDDRMRTVDYISCSSLVSNAPFKTAGLILNFAGISARRAACKNNVILREDSPLYKSPIHVVVGPSLEVASKLDEALEGLSSVEVTENATPLDIEGEFYTFMGESVKDIVHRSKTLLQALEKYGQEQSVKPYATIDMTLSWITQASRFRLSSFSGEIYFKIANLWSAICFILLKLLHDGRVNLTVCPHCRRVFLPSRSNQKFCSSSCRNRYTAKLSYQRRKQKEPGED